LVQQLQYLDGVSEDQSKSSVSLVVNRGGFVAGLLSEPFIMMAPLGITQSQLRSMMHDPHEQAERRKQRHISEPSTDGCGCCPICHEFVYAQFTQPGNLACCPRCDGLIDALDPLGIPSV